MQIHDPIATARDLAAFDFRVLAPFNGGAFGTFYGDRLDHADRELHPDTDELLMVLEGSVTVEILTDSEHTGCRSPPASSRSSPRATGTGTPTSATSSRCSARRARRSSPRPRTPGSPTRRPSPGTTPPPARRDRRAAAGRHQP